MDGQIIISKEIPLNPPLTKGVIPAEIQIIPFGFNSTGKGDFELDEQSAD